MLDQIIGVFSRGREAMVPTFQGVITLSQINLAIYIVLLIYFNKMGSHQILY